MTPTILPILVPRAVTVTLNPAVDARQEVPEPRLHVLNRARGVALEPSGKGINVARALRELGLGVVAVAPLGGMFGGFIQGELEARGLTLRAIPIAGETRLNFKVVGARGQVTEFNAPGPSLSSQELEGVWDVLRAEVQPGTLVALCGSLPPGAPPGLYGEWTRELRALGARVLVDAGGEALRGALASRPFLIKPNREEAEALLGAPISGERGALEAAWQLRDLGARNVVLSLGAEGALFLGEGALLAVPPSVAVSSTVGCGDALLAGLLAALLRGETWREAARFATALAAARAQQKGSVAFADPERARALLPDVLVREMQD